jgi:hypothetical protein
MQLNRTMFQSFRAALGLACFATLASLVVAPAALAQSGGGTRGPGARPPATPPKNAPQEQPLPGVLFEGEPYELQDLGLVLYLPVGSTISRSFIPGGHQAFLIEPDDGAWSLQIFVEKVLSLDMTPQRYLDNAIKLKQERRQEQFLPITKTAPLPYTEVDRTDVLKVSGLTGSRVYLQAPGVTTSPVIGLAAFQLDQREFLAFQFDTPIEHFEQTRQVFETIVAATRYEPPDPTRKAERAAMLAAGERFLESLTPQDLEAALPSGPTILRIYEPAKTGSDADAKEIGYQRVHIRTGQLGETTTRPRHTWTATERRFGFIATLEGRFLEGSNVIDVNATLYLSRDRTEETWSLITTVTGPNRETGKIESHSNNQTILRNGPRLTSRITAPATSPIVKDWVIPDRGYISGVETYLLPRLIANANLEVPFAFYHFHTARDRISLRQDTFTRNATGWTRREIRSELEPPYVSTYKANGELIRTGLPNGSVIEPIEPDRLVQLWKSKNLPIR